MTASGVSLVHIRSQVRLFDQKEILNCAHSVMLDSVSKSTLLTSELFSGSHRPTFLDLLTHWKGSAACKYDGYFLPKQLDEQVSTLAPNHMKKLKYNAFFGNTGHFDDMIDFAGSEGLA